jgi:SAM-dependent methyltransferase
MAHKAQMEYFLSIKKSNASLFKNKIVIDIGSLDVNGNNKYLFDDCLYIGIDVAPGRNVDFVVKGSEFLLPDESVDIIVSSECLEHDMFYGKTIKNAVRMLKPGGMLLFSCATTGRPEHGTRRSAPQAAPLLNTIDEWCDYYKNLTEADIREIIDIDVCFKQYVFNVNSAACDLYFVGIKNGEYLQRTDYSFITKGIDYAQAMMYIYDAENKLQHLNNQVLQKDETIASLRSCIIDNISDNISDNN